MAYDWTDENPTVGPKRELEPFYRVAISSACDFLEKLCALKGDEKRDLPVFTGGMYASAKNETGQEMISFIEAAMAGVEGDAVPTGAYRAQIITLAVRMAWVVKTGGFGDTGWDVMMKLLAKRAPQRVAAAAARPADPTPA